MPSLTITSNPDAQVLLIGGDLKIERRGVGRLTADVPPGFYKIKAERGGGTVEQLIELREDKDVFLPVDSFPAIAPIAPLLKENSSAIEALGTQAMARPPEHASALASYFGPASEPGILVLAHRALADGSDPLAGLRITRWDAREAVDLIATDEVSTATERWAAAWLPLRPGCNLLEISDAGQKVLQTVPVARTWQTRVFLRRRKWMPAGTPQPDTSDRRDWIDVSIQMARRDTPIVYSDHFETIEVARNALELTRTNFIAGDLIEALLTDKFENPIAGITGLHLFLEALEQRNRSPKSPAADREIQIDAGTAARAPQIIREGLGNLERLLGAGTVDAPSDLVALKLRAGLPPAGKTIVREPPMFWVSWDVLRRNSDADQPVEVAPDLWQRIAFANAWGPYLAWPPHETSVEDFLDRHVRSRLGEVTEAIAGSGATRMGGFLGRPHGAGGGPRLSLLEGAELAKELGIPLSVAATLKRDAEG